MASNTAPNTTEAHSCQAVLCRSSWGGSGKNHTKTWSALWDSNPSGLWDRGRPSPALIDLIESGPDVIPRPKQSDTRKPRALVPACGRGYDVIMLALHGYDAYGLEVSSTAVETAREYAAAQLTAPSEYNYADTNNLDR
ncbi:S-adenosyl-L-methionine-dependent methyltransferase [Achaetomium macrosporum]|uniref:S-adenosyl-L-methionine-dependent methyltransferase n=1 Tax=Achaetomium macrosporum TaxID=79813 RepID=A0AAN7C886_9PEZI|nr:S-adenosyl-L-methionine-dependent methyltransferase [Achaetomium macrosporum]